MSKKKDYVLIPLTRGLVTAISPEDEKRVRRHIWSTKATTYGRFIAVTYIKGKIMRLHRFLSKPSRHKDVDHWNGETLDNRQCNRRICTRSQNLSAFRKTRGSSKYRGVSWKPERKVWVVQIQHKGKHYFIGHFKNERIAAEAYDTVARRLKGRYVGINFPLNVERPPPAPKEIRIQVASAPAPYAKHRRKGSHQISPYIGIAHDKYRDNFRYMTTYKRRVYWGSWTKSDKQAALARDDLIIKNNWPHPLNFPKRKQK